jgi:hypothetical protein
MGRPKKPGLDYFPHDTDATSDPKISSLMALHGTEGYAFYFIMLEKVFRAENGRITAGKPVEKAGLARAIMISLPKFEKILATALELGCFDKEVYESEQVLTSSGIQKRLAKVAHEREQERIRKDNYNTKNKKKYKRERENYRRKTAGKLPENPQDVEIKGKYLRYVYLTKAEFDALNGKTNGKRDELIDRLDGYIGQIGEKTAAKKYVSHYDTMLNWYRKDNKLPAVDGDDRDQLKKQLASYQKKLSRFEGDFKHCPPDHKDHTWYETQIQLIKKEIEKIEEKLKT